MLNVLIFFIFLSYLIGSIPTGYWFCKLFFRLDITQHGSGNIGASNVARVLGNKIYFILIFLVDAVKAWLTLYLVDRMLEVAPSTQVVDFWLLVCAAALLLGNAYSIFLSFRGGKGVATLCGIATYLIPFHFLLLFACSWLFLLGLTRQVFVASLGASVFMTCVYGFSCATLNAHFYFLCVVCCWIVLRHKQNISKFFS